MFAVTTTKGPARRRRNGTAALLVAVLLAGCASPDEAGPDDGGGDGNRTGPGDGGGTGGTGGTDGGTVWEGLRLPPGVTGEVVVANLSFPTSLDWDANGTLYVGEVGFTEAGPRILRVLDDGTTEPVNLTGANLTEQLLDITWIDGRLWFTTTAIVHVWDPENGTVRSVVEGLPAWGDHRTDEVVQGPDGRIYVSQGTVTNSGVVGADQAGVPNAVNNVAEDRPGTHEVPCQDVRLSGWNWETTDFLDTEVDFDAYEGAADDARAVFYATEAEARAADTPRRDAGAGDGEDDDDDDDGADGADDATNRTATNATEDNETDANATDDAVEDDDGNMTSRNATRRSSDRAVTGPFVPFGTPTWEGQTIAGETKCNGAVLSFLPDGSDLRVEAWGYRNPFGLKFGPDGAVWVSNNGFDNRGSRPVGATPDELWRFEPGGDVEFAGWPDWSVGIPVTDPFFSPLFGPEVRPTLLEPPGPVEAPVTWFSSHASSNKFDWAPQGSPYAGDLFIAQFGTLNIEFALGALTGMDVARVDLDDGRVTEFITHADRYSGLFRPVEAVFGPDERLYVVDFGEWEISPANETASQGESVSNTLRPGTGRVLAFDLSGGDASWEGFPSGNPGGDGTRTWNGTVVNASEVADGAERVQVFEYGFGPAPQVPVGASLAFVNEGEEGHTATEVGGQWNSGFALAPGRAYVWTPEEPGTYRFYCAVHPVMRGTVTVTDAA